MLAIVEVDGVGNCGQVRKGPVDTLPAELGTPDTDRVTIVDVARLAGVSHSTVSRVLNRHPNVRPKTKAKVERAVAELGYVPNLSARSLAKGSPSVVAITVFNLDSPYTSQVVRHVDAELAHADLHLLLYASRVHDRRGFAQRVSAGLSQGLIIVSPQDEDVKLEGLIDQGYPIVLFDFSNHPRMDSLSGDSAAGTRDAVEHLLELGHRRIGVLAGDQDRPAGRVRLETFLKTMADHGVAVDQELVIEGEFNDACGYQLGGGLLDLANPPTAVVTACDVIALGLLRAAHERGLSVPGDLSVVGFDDLAEATRSSPTLTTVRQPLQLMSSQAVAMLRSRLSKPDIPVRHVTFPSELIVRDSTGPPGPRA